MIWLMVYSAWERAREGGSCLFRGMDRTHCCLYALQNAKKQHAMTDLTARFINQHT